MSSFAWFVARRYLTARRRQAFISLISAVSIIGVAVGVMALIIALALMTGVQTELRDRIVGSTAHVYVYVRPGDVLDFQKEEARLTINGVEGAAPAIVDKGMLMVSSGRREFVALKGIDPALEPRVTQVESAIRTGRLDALANRPTDARDGILLGSGLARSLGVSVGDAVTVVTGELTSTVFGLVARSRLFQVVGTFEFGFHEVDSSSALISLSTAVDIFNRPGPDLVQLRLTDMDEAPAIRERLESELGAGFIVDDWTVLNQPLYAALWLEKVAISLTIGLIVIVAALNIVASLVLLVMEKSKDIAILRTMGTSTAVIRGIFIYQGLTIGTIGTLAGTGLGLVVCFVADRYKLLTLPGDVYQITHVPFRVQTMDVVIVVVSAILVCLVATLYPSRQAARIDPAEALRNQ